MIATEKRYKSKPNREKSKPLYFGESHISPEDLKEIKRDRLYDWRHEDR